MEWETETRPLLRTLTRKTKKSICKRIPSEVAITGVIIGCFLTVVTVLLLLENLGGSNDSKEQLTLDSNLLGSSLNYNKMSSFASKTDKNSWKSKTSADNTNLNKVKNWLDGWRESYNVENFGDSLNKRVEAERQLFAYLKSSKDISNNELLQNTILEQFKDSEEHILETTTETSKKKKDKNKNKSKWKQWNESNDQNNEQSLEEDDGNMDENDFEPETTQKHDKNKNKNKWKEWGHKDKQPHKQSTEGENENIEENNFKSMKDFQEFLKMRLEADENILENLQDSPANIGITDINLLSSPFKYNKKALDLSWQNKGDFKDFFKNSNSKFNKAWKDRTKASDAVFPNLFVPDLRSPAKESDQEINLLGSPFKYNKKAFDTTWQDKKYPNNDFNKFKYDNVDKGWKKFYPLGSTYEAKNVDTNLQISDSPSKSENENLIWDVVKGVWNKVSQKGDKILQEFEKFNDCWKSAENLLKSENGAQKPKHINSKMAAPVGCPFSNSGKNLLQSPANTETQVNCALISEQVRLKLGKCIDLSFLPKECKPVWRNKCFTTYKYRKIDGSCNNQIHPTWGKSGTPYVRMMAPDYGDGVSSIRTSKTGEPLPNARFLSQKLYSKKLKPDIEASLLFMYFGLLVDHDMVETAINSANLPCCDEKFEKYPERRPRECLQVSVSPDDPFYGPRNVKCLGVVRSLPVNGECIGRREQLNFATSYLDGSVIYGSTMQKMKSLRSFSKGQLRSQDINKTPYMASSDISGYNCGTPSEPYKCFDAGDSRVNMLVELTAMHTLWYREHNRLAEELHRINPKWTDETLFQEARRILIAELQYITFKEFLPLLLGSEAMDYFQLSIDDDMYYDGYDDTIDPSVFNVFGAAAFRFGHSLVQDTIHLMGPDNKTEERIPLRDTYFNPQLLYQKGLDYLLRGAASQQLRSVDSYISKEVREHLFQASGKDFGHDLAAVGIQRGRDHGIPGYTKWRSACGLSEVKSWEDLKTVMNVERAVKLQEVYQSVEDIDLIPGGLAEDHAEGSLVGPTYLCIIGRQFKKTRKGDRLWFEIQDKLGSFTADQLKEIYKSGMARIVCDNSDGIQKIQQFPFKVASSENPLIECENVSKVDLSKWKSTY